MTQNVVRQYSIDVLEPIRENIKRPSLAPYPMQANSTLAKGTVVAALTSNKQLTTFDSTRVAVPAAAPVVANGAAGTVPAGNYTIGYTFVNANGETTLSPVVQWSPGDSLHKGSVSAVTPLPTGATSVNWYITALVGSPVLRLFKNNDGSAFVFDAADLTAALAAVEPPLTNTCRAKTDGTAKAIGILRADSISDANNLITQGNTVLTEILGELTTEVWIGGEFATAAITGLNADAIADLGGRQTSDSFIF